MEWHSNKTSPRKIWQRLNMVESPFWQKGLFLAIITLLITIPSVVAINYFIGLNVTGNTINPIITSSGTIALNDLIPLEERTIIFNMNNTRAIPQNIILNYNQTSNQGGVLYTVEYTSTNQTLLGNSVNDMPFKFKIKSDTGFGNFSGQIGWAFA